MNSPKPPPPLNSLELAFSGWGFKWSGLIDNRQGEWWLGSQLCLITAHFIPPWPSVSSWEGPWLLSIKLLGLGLLISGITLAIRSLIKLGASLSPFPDPKPGSSLVTLGPYKRCRHPLYQALLISSAGITIFLGSVIHIMLLFCLCFVLIGKAKREERKLKRLYPEYIPYLIKTPAIFSGIPILDWRN